MLKKFTLAGLILASLAVSVPAAEFNPWNYGYPVIRYSDLSLNGNFSSRGNRNNLSDLSTGNSYFNIGLGHSVFYQNDSLTVNYSISGNGTIQHQTSSQYNSEQKYLSGISAITGSLALNRYLSTDLPFFLGTTITPELRATYTHEETSWTNFNRSVYSLKGYIVGVFGIGRIRNVSAYYKVHNILKMLSERYHLKISNIPESFVTNLTAVLYRRTEYIRKYNEPHSSSMPNTYWIKHFYADIQRCLETLPELKGHVDFYLLGLILEMYDEYHPTRRCGFSLYSGAGYRLIRYEYSDDTRYSHNDLLSLTMYGEMAAPLSSRLYLSSTLRWTSYLYEQNELESSRLDFNMLLALTLSRTSFLDLVCTVTLYRNSPSDQDSYAYNCRLIFNCRIAPSLFLGSSIGYSQSGRILDNGVYNDTSEWRLSSGLTWRIH